MIILTIDTDWAPDEATAEVLRRVRELEIKVTTFFSTPAPVDYWPELEVGCHPDLSRRGPASPAGGLEAAGMEHLALAEQAEEAVIRDYRAAFPTALAVRTHRFHWHSDLPRLFTRHGFCHDSSLILPYHPGLKGFKTGRLTRWPVWASDHLHLARRLPCDRLEMPHWREPGLKIFCFHVAYLYLNTSSLKNFNMITSGRPSGGLRSSKTEVPGVWDLFKLLAARIKSQGRGCWLSETPPEFTTDLETV
ncbi:MAG: hypothetical protein LBS31_08130 [Candidatus Adiutrix sp.]|jgi:hypothetical protein|nr:hypothetical protein [Candidatus Adiutrix sp.]